MRHLLLSLLLVFIGGTAMAQQVVQTDTTVTDSSLLMRTDLSGMQGPLGIPYDVSLQVLNLQTQGGGMPRWFFAGTSDTLPTQGGPGLVVEEVSTRYDIEAFGFDTVLLEGAAMLSSQGNLLANGVITGGADLFRMTLRRNTPGNVPDDSTMAFQDFTINDLMNNSMVSFDSAVDITSLQNDGGYYLGFQIDGTVQGLPIDDSLQLAHSAADGNYGLDSTGTPEQRLWYRFNQPVSPQTGNWADAFNFYSQTLQIQGLDTVSIYPIYFPMLRLVDTMMVDTTDTSITGAEDPFVRQNGLKLFPPFPNPASNEANFRFELDRTSDVRFLLTDLQGRVVFREEFAQLRAGEHSIPVNLTDLPSGTYTYFLQSSRGRVASKLVVQH